MKIDLKDMVIREQKLMIPWLGISANKVKGYHWSKISANNKEGKRQTWKALLIADFKKVDYPVILISTPHLQKGKRSFDCTNYFWAHKAIEDGLVSAEILPGDTPKFVKSCVIMAPVYDYEYGIEMIIRELI